MTLPWPWWLILWLHRFALAMPWIAAAVVVYVVISLWREKRRHREATRFAIRQEHNQYWRSDTMITGVQVGASGQFTATPNGALQAGSVPVWSSTDPNVTFVPAADGLSAQTNLASAETAATFPIMVSGVNSADAAISTTATVPVLPAPPVPATGFDLEQSS